MLDSNEVLPVMFEDALNLTMVLDHWFFDTLHGDPILQTVLRVVADEEALRN